MLPFFQQFEDEDLKKTLDSDAFSGAITVSGKIKTASVKVTKVTDDSIDTKVGTESGNTGP